MKKNTYVFLILLLLFTVSVFGSSIQRVRINFTGPDSYTRHLLLAFTEDVATDAYDYGYDALNIDDFPNDLNWMIENDRYVIQGVGAFEITKAYRLGMFLNDSGNIQIGLQALENFDQEIPVYVYDSLDGSFTSINDIVFESNVLEGDYTNRFYITFTNSIELLIESDAILSTEDNIKEAIKIVYYNSLNQLVIKSNHDELFVKELEIYCLDGKKTFHKKINSEKATINLQLLPSGVYIINSITNNNLKVSKLISI